MSSTLPYVSGCRFRQGATNLSIEVDRPLDQMVQARISPCVRQRFTNGEVHDWYRFVLGYSDKLVSKLLDDWRLTEHDLVLDPFCGSGTTLVECKKRGVPSVGIDANPVAAFASRVKTNWSVEEDELRGAVPDIEARYEQAMSRVQAHRSDPTYKYLSKSGLIKRGWISPRPLRKALAVKSAVRGANLSAPVRDALLLALVSEVVLGASNVRFGPELYCGKPKQDAEVLQSFLGRVSRVASDLEKVKSLSATPSEVILGDARSMEAKLGEAKAGKISAIICSPPYPTEHDYTRNTRLELAFLDFVTDRPSLQEVKKRMVRSHTKGIYVGDNDSSSVSSNATVARLAQEVDDARTGTSGFEQLYPTVVREYFGGMLNHFVSALNVLIPGGRAAYVVGDQRSYNRVSIPTAIVLEELATIAGFQSLGIMEWRNRWSSTTSSHIGENILLLEKPGEVSDGGTLPNQGR